MADLPSFWRKASMRYFLLQNTQDQQLCQSDERRCHLIISSADSGSAALGLREPAPALRGFIITPGTGPLDLSRAEHGDACTSAWFGRNTLGSTILAVLEVFDP